MIIAGVDLSLTATGLVVLDGNKIIERKIIRSKKLGDKPKDELERLMVLTSDVADSIEKHAPEVIAIEGLAFAISKTVSFAQLSALHYMVRAMFPDTPALIVAPPTLKKFITGKGNGPKDLMLLETYKRYGVTFADDNECDAYCLARTAQAVFDKTAKTTKAQKEVISLLNKQL